MTVELSEYNPDLVYKIYSITGVLIETGLLQQEANVIDINEVPAGNYSIEISDLISGQRSVELFEKIG